MRLSPTAAKFLSALSALFLLTITGYIALDEAATYLMKAGRRVIILITGVTRNFDCKGGPSNKAVTHTLFESSSVVCGLIPRTPGQVAENAAMRWATRFGKLAGASYLDIQKLADDTGGEVLRDSPEQLDYTFDTLITHLRSRYILSFVSSNKKRDGTVLKLKVEPAKGIDKSQGELVVKARRSYVAPKQ